MERLQRSQLWVCALVLMLGLVSALLGILAKVKRIKASKIRVQDGECVYPKSPALALGVMAALVLSIAQITVSLAGRCVCCAPCQPVPGNLIVATNRSIAIICLVACWITFLNAFALLMDGVSLNYQRQPYMWFGGDCNVVKPLVFARGALLAVATVVLGVIFYLAASVAKAGLLASENAVHAVHLGQPYPVVYIAPLRPSQAYPFPYCPSFPSQTQTPQPNNFPVSFSYPPVGYPELVTGYPKPMPLDHSS